MIYGILLIILSFCAIVHHQIKLGNNQHISVNTYGKAKKTIFSLVAISFIIIIGCRSELVGIDTKTYKDMFQLYSQKDWNVIQNLALYEEIGYKLLMILFGKLSLTWESYSVFVSMLYIIPMIVLIYSESESPYFSLMIFIMNGLFTFPMSTIRQSIAMGITTSAFLLYKKGKKLWCILLILVASCFHVSALICLLFLAVLNIGMTRKNLKYWLLGGLLATILGTIFLQDIFMDLLQEFGHHYENITTGGWLRELFFVLTLLLVYVGTYYHDNFVIKHQIYIKALIISAVLLPVVRLNPTFMRIYYYFSLYEMILIPSIIRVFTNRVVRFAGYAAYIITYLYFMYSQVLTEGSQLLPYLFFWS